MIRCPNMCFNGKIKHFPDESKALFVLIGCPYCKGKGEVSENEYKIINSKL